METRVAPTMFIGVSWLLIVLLGVAGFFAYRAIRLRWFPRGFEQEEALRRKLWELDHDLEAVEATLKFRAEAINPYDRREFLSSVEQFIRNESEPYDHWVRPERF